MITRGLGAIGAPSLPTFPTEIIIDNSISFNNLIGNSNIDTTLINSSYNVNIINSTINNTIIHSSDNTVVNDETNQSTIISNKNVISESTTSK